MENTEKLNGAENSTLNIPDVVQRYGLLQVQCPFTGEMYETWFRPDMLLFVERWALEKGKFFRILASTNDVSKVGHIDFTRHYYKDFEDAVKAMVELNVA